LGSANLALLVNPRARAGFFASCLRLMDATLARNPASARALAVKLRVMPRPDAASYSRAQAAAPAEPWPLTHRLLSLEAAGPLPDPMASVAARDMAAAFATPWGRDVLAGLYLRDDALRDLILRTAGDRPGAEQAAFLAAVQRILSGNG
ncbi:MAG: hypothetical protein EBU97_04000, partial [Rhodobacteraceae bacterium]|nr:hypothetical protein [Paracoccaceae bacterium]